MIEVVTVWAPRPDHAKFFDYTPLLRCQRHTARRVGHKQVVVTETAHKDFDCLVTGPLSASLMHAILEGQLAYMRQWSDQHPVVMVDADCIVIRDLKEAFTGDWDMAMTWRDNDVSPIQNGAMYFAPGSRAAAIELFTAALGYCGTHWGGDQEAISRAVAPVPRKNQITRRFGKRFGFLSCEYHNHTFAGQPHKLARDRFIEHFKGEHRKAWTLEFVKRFLTP